MLLTHQQGLHDALVVSVQDSGRFQRRDLVFVFDFTLLPVLSSHLVGHVVGFPQVLTRTPVNSPEWEIHAKPHSWRRFTEILAQIVRHRSNGHPILLPYGQPPSAAAI